MPKGVKGKRKNDKSRAAPAKPVGVWVWAQCDNAGCQKWRKLPPGTVIDDKEPWFCYMNPNEDQNDCNIPEEAYDAATEAAVYSYPVSEDEAQSAEQDRAWTPASEAAAKQRASLSNGRQYQRSTPEPSTSGRAQGLAEATPAPSMSPGLPSTSGAAWGKPETGSLVGSEGRDGGAHTPQNLRGIRKARRAHHGFNKLLAVGGVWEVTKGKGKAVTAPPAWIWDGLATHAPSGAVLACEAADVSSAARYFEMIQAPRGSDQARKAADTARLALTAAAALAIQETREIPGIDDSPTLGASGVFDGQAAAAALGEEAPEVDLEGQQPPVSNGAAVPLAGASAGPWGAQWVRPPLWPAASGAPTLPMNGSFTHPCAAAVQPGLSGPLLQPGVPPGGMPGCMPQIWQEAGLQSQGVLHGQPVQLQKGQLPGHINGVVGLQSEGSPQSQRGPRPAPTLPSTGAAAKD